MQIRFRKCWHVNAQKWLDEHKKLALHLAAKWMEMGKPQAYSWRNKKGKGYITIWCKYDITKPYPLSGCTFILYEDCGKWVAEVSFDEVSE